jgi:hypothetical protein
MDHYDEGGRRPWGKVAGFALVGLLLLAGGIGIGRWSAGSGSAGSRSGSSGQQSGPGPTRTENGVPVGYAHTPDGAVAAATNFLAVQDGPLITRPDQYRSAIDTLAAPESPPYVPQAG